MMLVRNAVIAACLAFAACSNDMDLQIANRGVTLFHRRLDAGEVQAIYSEASFDWKHVRGRETSVEFLTELRRELGSYRGGKTLEWRERSAGGNGFVTLLNEAEYERGKGRELFLWRINGQQAQLARYRITIGGVSREWPTPAPRPLANVPLAF